LGSRRQAPDGWEAVTPWLKTQAPVSCPTEALFFAAVPPELLLPQRFGQALAVESSATAAAYEDSFSGFLCQSFHEIQRDQLSG
jgi:hypothetical protein